MEQAAIGLGPVAAGATVPARDVKRVAANTRRAFVQILALASPSSARGTRTGPTPDACRTALGLLIALVVAFGGAHAALAEGVEAFRYSTSGDGRGHWIGVLPDWSRATRSGRPVVERQTPLRGLDLHHDPVPSLHLECRAPPPGGAEANPEDPGRPFTAYLTARKWRQDPPARLWGDPEQWTSLAIDWLLGGIEPAFEEEARTRVWAADGGVQHTGSTTVRRLAYDWSAETRYVAMLDAVSVRAGLKALEAAGEGLLAIAVEGKTIRLEARYAFPPRALARTLHAARACDSAPSS